MNLSELTPQRSSGLIQDVEPGSLAEALGLRPGDEVLRVNAHPVEDVIDVQFYAAEDEVEVAFRREGLEQAARGGREPGQALGLTFAHPTFDIDIRRCNNLCPFCFVLQTAPRMRRTLYIKDDDYRYSFLFGHFVTLTNLSPHDWERIDEQHLSPLYVSVHSTDLENRRACLANPTAPDVLAQLRWLAERGIELHTQLVITPGLNDGPWMERSLADLAELYPGVRSVSVVPVGLTRHHKYGHRPHTPAEAEAVLEALERWQGRCLERLGVRFVYASDEWYLVTHRPVPLRKHYDGLHLEENGVGMVRGFLDDWKKVRRELKKLVADSRDDGRQTTDDGPLNKAARKSPPALRPVLGLPSSVTLRGRAVTLVTATLFEATLRSAAEEFNKLAGTKLRVVTVLNERLGHTITVAGLLMAEDVVNQLSGQALGEAVILPRVMFDHPQGISLDDLSPLTIAQRLGCTVFLADAMGDVLDALTGANTLRFDPDMPAIPPDVMKAGGWAVEKYL